MATCGHLTHHAFNIIYILRTPGQHFSQSPFATIPYARQPAPVAWRFPGRLWQRADIERHAGTTPGAILRRLSSAIPEPGPGLMLHLSRRRSSGLTAFMGVIRCIMKTFDAILAKIPIAFGPSGRRARRGPGQARGWSRRDERVVACCPRGRESLAARVNGPPSPSSGFWQPACSTGGRHGQPGRDQGKESGRPQDESI